MFCERSRSYSSRPPSWERWEFPSLSGRNAFPRSQSSRTGEPRLELASFPCQSSAPFTVPEHGWQVAGVGGAGPSGVPSPPPLLWRLRKTGMKHVGGLHSFFGYLSFSFPPPTSRLYCLFSLETQGFFFSFFLKTHNPGENTYTLRASF